MQTENEIKKNLSKIAKTHEVSLRDILKRLEEDIWDAKFQIAKMLIGIETVRKKEFFSSFDDRVKSNQDQINVLLKHLKKLEKQKDILIWAAELKE